MQAIVPFTVLGLQPDHQIRHPNARLPLTLSVENLLSVETKMLIVVQMQRWKETDAIANLDSKGMFGSLKKRQKYN